MLLTIDLDSTGNKQEQIGVRLFLKIARFSKVRASDNTVEPVLTHTNDMVGGTEK